MCNRQRLLGYQRDDAPRSGATVKNGGRSLQNFDAVDICRVRRDHPVKSKTVAIVVAEYPEREPANRERAPNIPGRKHVTIHAADIFAGVGEADVLLALNDGLIGDSNPLRNLVERNVGLRRRRGFVGPK